MNDIIIKFLKLADATVSNFSSEPFNLCILESEFPDDLG